MMMIMIVIILLHKSERGNSKAQMQPKTGRREQIPGRGKEYILGCLHFGKKNPGSFAFWKSSFYLKFTEFLSGGKFREFLFVEKRSQVPFQPCRILLDIVDEGGCA